MASADKMRSLVDGLYEGTMSGKIEWELSWGDDLPEAEFGGFKVRLSARTDDDGEPFEVVEILDNNGKEIDEFNDSALKRYGTAFGFQSYYYVMNELRQSAYRSASGADKALDAILVELNQKK